MPQRQLPQLPVGTRVRLAETRRWGEIAPWPEGLPEVVKALQKTHVCVRPDVRDAGEELLQYWPKNKLLQAGESEPPSDPPRFSATPEQA